MKQGISLHIGLNKIDPKHYGGWDGKLIACEYDAKDMCLIAESQGFKSKKLLSEEATKENVISGIKNAASILKSGDILCLTYSGHGGQVPDINSDETDGMDETWCLFDKQIIDDELANLWSLFARNVRILVFSDSCHSGTITKSARNNLLFNPDSLARFMPSEIVGTTYFRNKPYYDKILKENKILKPIKASVKLISGCQDNQSSLDGPFNGTFTRALKTVWNGGKFNGNYNSFHKRIMNLLPQNQSPNHYNSGMQNIAFDNQKPFTI